MLDLDFAQLLIAFLVLLFSLTVHESAHAWTADRLGDPTARHLGRISLNPAVHIDPIGTVALPLIAALTRAPLIGWAKPVPVNILRLRRHRRDYLFVAAAGPASNLLLALAASAAMKIVSTAPQGLHVVMVRMIEINVLLALFNMIPIPPLDGGNVLSGLLPPRLSDRFDAIRPYGVLLIYGLLLTGILSALVTPPYYLLLAWLLG